MTRRPLWQRGLSPPHLHHTHHLWLKASLLTVWVVVTFGGGRYFARVLQKEGGQWGYWMAAQGSVLVFFGHCGVLLVGHGTV